MAWVFIQCTYISTRRTSKKLIRENTKKNLREGSREKNNVYFRALPEKGFQRTLPGFHGPFSPTALLVNTKGLRGGPKK